MLETAARRVQPRHLAREACLYVRQSSLKQVACNTESTYRQYDLRRAAIALGWSEDRIRVIDDDQGLSGAYSANRSGFQDLLARIAASEVGIVLSLEVSRLARDNADWARLVQYARLTDTLILDESGVHDPQDSSDKLLLDIKGSVSEFELAGIRARLLGGQRSKAARGELRVTLPLGLVYDEHGRVAFDPDREVLEALRRVFAAFRDKGSAMQVVKWFRQERLLLPHRARTGPSRGVLRWSLPDHAKIRRILKNPAYAGAYTYGKVRVTHQPDGSVRYQTLPMEQWQVCIPDHHEGFIDWEQYRRNLETLARNSRCFAASPDRLTAPRNGAALLQGLVLCGHCGRRLRVLYSKARPDRKRPAQVHYMCRDMVAREGRKTCQSIPAAAVDAAVGRFVVAAMNQQNIALALAVQEQVRTDFDEADSQRALRIERLSYEAELAQRRYYAVDPGNRLVVAPLEAAWNEQLRELEQALRERDERRAAREAEMSVAQRQRIEALAGDFARVWNAPATEHVDRKRLLRLLVEDITLARDGYQVGLNLRLRGGQSVALGAVELNRPRQVKYALCAATVAALDTALDMHSDAEAAELLNRAGHRQWNGEPYTLRAVFRLRARVGMKGHLERRQARLRARGYVTAGELAKQLGRSSWSVKAMGRQGRLLCEPIKTGQQSTAMYKLPPGHDEAGQSGSDSPQSGRDASMKPSERDGQEQADGAPAAVSEVE